MSRKTNRLLGLGQAEPAATLNASEAERRRRVASTILPMIVLSRRDRSSAATMRAAACHRVPQQLRAVAGVSAHAARACSASCLSTWRSTPGARTRCGNGSRSAVRSSCSSSPSGSQPTQRQSPSGAPSSLVA